MQKFHLLINFSFVATELLFLFGGAILAVSCGEHSTAPKAPTPQAPVRNRQT